MENEDIYSNFTAKLWSPEDLPQNLYHYTTTEGARSIVSNEKKLWASSFETMNDNQELRKGLNIAKCDLVPFLSQISIDDLTKLLTKNWHNFLDEEIRNPKMRPYILCFTEHCESKLHWETYGDNFKGIAIEFSHKFDLLNSTKGFFIKVVYDEITARESLRINFRKATDLFMNDYSQSSNVTEDEARQKLANLFQAYIQIIFHFSISLKEAKWAGEQEWRFVSFATGDRSPQSNYNDIKYRTRKSELIDYLVISTLECGYELSGAKKGYHFPDNCSNGLNLLLKNHSIRQI